MARSKKSSKSSSLAPKSQAAVNSNGLDVPPTTSSAPAPLKKDPGSIYEQGELILKEEPLFQLPPGLEENHVRTRQYLKDKLATFTADQRTEYMSLWYKPETPKQDVLRAIFMANSYSTHDSMAVFPKAARMNHACAGASNVAYSWRQREGRFYLHALRDVKEGEARESSCQWLTPAATQSIAHVRNCYQPTSIPKCLDQSDSEKILKEKYHFDCQCASCTLPEDLSMKSDERLSSINGLFERLMGWNTNMLSGKQVIEIVNKIWALAEEENLSSQFGELAGLGAMVSAAHSDQKATAEWSQLGARWLRISFGKDDINAKNSEMWSRQPTTHPAFGKKYKMMVAPPPTTLKQRKSFTVLIEENKRRVRLEAAAAAASPRPRLGAGSSRQASASPSKKRVGFGPEQRHQRATHRLVEKIAELEVRARTAILEKNSLHNELTILQDECRRSAEREAALRVALERAEAGIKGETDQGQNPLVLQRKLEDLERVHNDGMHKHIVELDGLSRKLEEAEKMVKEQDDVILLQHQRATEKDNMIVSLEATVAKQEAELESLKVQLREAEIRQLAGSNAVNTLSDERRRHEVTKAKLKALQASGRARKDSDVAQSKLSALEGNFSVLDHKYSELKSAARTLADEYEAQSLELDAMSELLIDLTGVYSRYASLHRAEDRVVGDLKFEKYRLQLQLAALERELAAREAQLDDLEEIVEESRDARRILEAALADSEEEISMLRERIAQGESVQEVGDWDLYRLLNDYVEAFVEWESSQASWERARTEGELQSLRGINDVSVQLVTELGHLYVPSSKTLEQTIRTGDDIQKKLSNIEVQFTTLQLQSKAKAAAQRASLEEVTIPEPGLPDAKPSVVAVQPTSEQEEPRSPTNSVQTVNVPVKEPEQPEDKDSTDSSADRSMEVKPDSPTLPVESPKEPEQSQETLTPRRLKELNAAFLTRSNSSNSSSSSQGTWRNANIAPTERPSKSIAELRAQFGARK
ncbi:hypothetical protein FS837_012629 [Tulasnella sp. UAMH 9824]|nr:hypothetical protein FS837_012629 [Tulasnella sp. UAMH 9824]